ncbi:MAG: PDDEXK nuclease domain-containing protein [Methanothrix sp.]
MKEGEGKFGRIRGEASFPALPGRMEMPEHYAAILGQIKERIRSERLRVVMAANASMVLLYWDIGRVILERQEEEGWGAKVIERLSADLREAFPEMQGLSSRNLKYMRAFAAAWQDRRIVQEVLAQITWYHNIALLEKVRDQQVRLWYARKGLEEGWSRNVLVMQIESRLHERQGKAITNFSLTLPPGDSDMATQVFKDPYLFDFLGTAEPRREREVEQGLVDHMQRFLLELGSGFAFVGRQVHLEFASKDYYLDLLFYHLRLRCFVVVELKAGAFDPGFVGTLNMYLSAVDDLLRHHDDSPSIGLLLCRSESKIEVEYALRGMQKPMGVASWETRLVKSLPEELKGSLPTVAEIEAELSGEKGR